MPRRSWKIPFAVSGDVQSVPTATQPDGSVSIQQGYGFDYERPTDGSDPLGKVFPRQPHNALLNEITASIGEIQQFGYPIWAADMTPYPLNARVRNGDVTYVSAVANNNSVPGANTDWVNSDEIGGRLIGSRSYTVAGVNTYTPTPGTKRVKVTLVGGGGASGSAAATSGTTAAMGQPGSAGAIAVGYFDVDFSTITVTVGKGGDSGGGAGQAGTASTFGAKMSAPGGRGGMIVGGITGAYWVAASDSSAAPTGANLYGAAGARGTSGQILQLNTGGAGIGGNSALGGNIGKGGDGIFNIPSQALKPGNKGDTGIAIIEEFS